jgi:Putative MetA-pathway of phenol degradation
MRDLFRLGFAAALAVCALPTLFAQDLAPRAYVVTPTRTNAVTVAWSFYDGNIDFNGALPISGATGKYNIPIVSFYHSFGFFGRSANLVASLPYAFGHFRGTVAGAESELYRSGLIDSVYRVSVNLKGGPAMPLQDFAKWKQKVLLGVSLKVIAPTGQYDPTKLINWGTNRWSFKPEFGYSQRWGKWVVDGYAGVWFFTTNHDFFSRNSYFPGTRSQSQNPIGALEGHLSYDFKPRLWVSLDGNYWFGGKTSIDGIENPLTYESNSRLGGTASVPITKHQSLKFSYSNGTYIRFGGNYQNLSLAWQYSWFGKPRQ